MRAVMLTNLPALKLKEGDEVEVTRAPTRGSDFCLVLNPSGLVVQVPPSALRWLMERKAKASTGQSLNPARNPIQTNVEDL